MNSPTHSLAPEDEKNFRDEPSCQRCLSSYLSVRSDPTQTFDPKSDDCQATFTSKALDREIKCIIGIQIASLSKTAGEDIQYSDDPKQNVLTLASLGITLD